MAIHMPFAAKALLLASASLVLFAATASASDVVDATDANFADVIKSSEMVLVEFYAPWCGHCKKLAPEWEEAATLIKGKAVLAKMDATEQPVTPEKFQVRGYPTIKIFRDGEVAGEYDGKRNAAGIAEWVKANTGPAITTLTTKDEIEAAKAELPVIVVANIADSSSVAFITFDSVAKVKRSQYRFFHIADPTLMAEGHQDKIVVFKQFDEAVEIFPAAEVNSAKELSEFIQNAGIRLFDEMGPENYQDYMTRNAPIGWLFALPADAASDSAKEAVKAVAAEFKGKISMVWIDAAKYGGMASRVGLKGTKFPAFAVDHQEKHFAFDEKAEITEAALSEFLGKYIAGDLKESIMTEEAPAQHTVDGLTTVVGSTFKQLVQESDVDTFIEFYAPWCGHCKKLAPIFQSLASKLAPVEGIRVAMIDATANDYDKRAFAVQGFPTIMFVPKNGGTVVNFEEDRSVEGMMAFIKKHSSANFDSVKDEL